MPVPAGHYLGTAHPVVDVNGTMMTALAWNPPRGEAKVLPSPWFQLHSKSPSVILGLLRAALSVSSIKMVRIAGEMLAADAAVRLGVIHLSRRSRGRYG